MQKDEFTMADMIEQIIESGQLSYNEEIKIRKMIEEKRKDKCLADIIELEVERKLDFANIKMKNMCKAVHKKCFKETRTGTMSPFNLSEKIIKKFEKDVRELYGLNENEMIVFMGMLQIGLNKMSEEGILDFVPDKNMYYNFINIGHKISYIDNPYSNKDTEKIMEWSEKHSADVKGLAVSLWFTGGIALTEIVNLTKKDCWGGKREVDSIMEFDENLFSMGVRPRIVRKSLDMHPKDVKYVFVTPRKDGSGWKKLTEQELQKKLWSICQKMGIVYKSVKKNEAIKINR